MPQQQSFHDRQHNLRMLQAWLIRDSKHYIMANWQQVRDWSALDMLTLETPDDQIHYFYLPVDYPEINSVDPGNPVHSLGDVQLDESDYELSLRLNGHAYWPVPAEAVVKLAVYIENYLDDNKLTPLPFKSTYSGPVALGMV